MADTTAGPPGRPAREPDRAVFIISVAAELAGVHPQTLRIYERKGLLHPKRTQKNSRRYSERDIERLREIQELTAQGVNLAGVRRIMAMDRQIEKLQTRLAELEQELVDMQVRHRAELEAVKRAARREIVPYSAAMLLYRPPPSEPPVR